MKRKISMLIYLALASVFFMAGINSLSIPAHAETISSERQTKQAGILTTNGTLEFINRLSNDSRSSIKDNSLMLEKVANKKVENSSERVSTSNKDAEGLITSIYLIIILVLGVIVSLMMVSIHERNEWFEDHLW